MMRDTPVRRPTFPRQILIQVSLFATLMVAVGTVSFLNAKRGDWESVFVPAGLRLRTGQDIFQDGYFYPPFQALLAVPFSWLPQIVARAAWAFLNALGAATFVFSAWRLSGGQLPGSVANRLPTEIWIFALGAAASISFFLDAITNGQTDLLLAALITGGCLLGSRAGVAGPALIGIAAGAKCTPLLFVPWFVLRRRWLAIFALIAFALGVNLLPDLFFPPADGELRLFVWARTYLAGLFGADYVPGAWFTAPEFNHSLAGFLGRFLPAQAVHSSWFFATSVLIALAAFVMWRRETVDSKRIERFEIGMILCLMVLLSPVSSKPHFVILLFPAWAVARQALLRRDRCLLTSIVLCALAGLISNKDLVGSVVYDATKWWGVITLEALVLLSACLWARWRYRNESPIAAAKSAPARAPHPLKLGRMSR